MVADATNPALRFDESIRFTVEGADGAALSGWRPVAYAVTERVHAPWEARVELVADGDGSEGTAWIDRALTLRLVRGAQSRVWRGVVTEVESAVTPEEGATVLVIPVRCDRAGVLARGAKALVIDFDPVRHAYVVEPVADLLPTAPTGADGSV